MAIEVDGAASSRFMDVTSARHDDGVGRRQKPKFNQSTSRPGIAIRQPGSYEHDMHREKDTRAKISSASHGTAPKRMRRSGVRTSVAASASRLNQVT